MLVYVVIGNRKWDGSYIIDIHKDKEKANKLIKKLNDYISDINIKAIDIKTKYYLEIWDVTE